MAISPLSTVCHACLTDGYLGRLKEEMHLLQQKLRLVWVSSKDVVVSSHLVTDDVATRYLTDGRGYVTLLPTYRLYGDLWKGAMYQNPMEVNWLSFEVHDSWDRKYVEDVLETMEEQIGLWRAENVTFLHPMFQSFLSFVDCVRRFYEYAYIGQKDHFAHSFVYGVNTHSFLSDLNLFR